MSHRSHCRSDIARRHYPWIDLIVGMSNSHQQILQRKKLKNQEGFQFLQHQRTQCSPSFLIYSVSHSTLKIHKINFFNCCNFSSKIIQHIYDPNPASKKSSSSPSSFSISSSKRKNLTPSLNRGIPSVIAPRHREHFSVAIHSHQ